MRRIRLSCTLLFCLAFSPLKLRAQAPPASTPATGSTVATTPSAPVAAADPQTPEEFFARARQLSDLEASGIPFHLKATYVASGDAEFTGNGTYEEWWQSKDLWRKEATLGDYKYVEIQNGDKHSVYGSSNYVPWRLRQVLDVILVRIPTDTENVGTWKMRHKKIDKANFIVLTQRYPCPAAGVKRPDEKDLSTQKCLQLGNSVLQAYFTPEGVLRVQVGETETAMYNGIIPFRNLIISRNVVVSDGGKDKGFPISIELLEPLSPGEKESLLLAAAPVDMKQLVSRQNLTPVQIREGVTPPVLTRQVSPVIPWSVRELHQSVEKLVVVEAIIDELGNVRETHVIQSAGSDLDDAAVTAVAQYKFKPAKYKGSPVPVKIHIVVAFHISA